MKIFILFIILLPIMVTSSASQNSVTNSIGMEFVLIPSGEFEMGSPSNEEGRYDNEGPVHRVEIPNAFYIGKYEVTQKQWHDVMGNNPSKFKGDNLPVDSISWEDVQIFIDRLNEKEGGNKYRLPSEAEWEYAARAGTTTKFSFGDDESVIGDYAWTSANAGSKTHDVGQKKPNPWGLYDIHGNVWEWVQDNWHVNYNGAPIDGSAWENGDDSWMVLRGGDWLYYAGNCRSARRHIDHPSNRDGHFGFRILIANTEYSNEIPLPTEEQTIIRKPLKTPTISSPKASVEIYGTKTDVKTGEDILLKVSAVSLITKPKMHIQIILVVPPGFSVTSMDYVKSSSNQYTSNYEVQPGDQINVDVNIKPNQYGDFNVKGKIIYYFGEDKENGEYEERDLPIKVRDVNPQPTIPGFEIEISIFWILLITLFIRKRC